MKLRCVTEIVEFKISPGISEEEFVQIVDSLEVNYHSQQKGFMDTELVKGREEGQWLMIQHWNSTEEAKESSRKMFKTETTEAFRSIIDPKSVRMLLGEQIKSWNPFG
ncbi:MAG: antibiotic biosynthesis monooxygenase [Clostridia bacterium]|nr:antibiotic biosynthesis monooxygenase [Clostridia bacterium]